jgi:4-amino-4-deoxy-L-arabinose transferase-like glycosyltransferase
MSAAAADPGRKQDDHQHFHLPIHLHRPHLPEWIWFVAVIAAIASSLVLIADASVHCSATYDETAYLRIAADWWKSGHDTAIARMGSPRTFFKLQYGPMFWMLERARLDDLLDDPEANIAVLLPMARLSGMWLWVVALVATSAWARAEHGPRAMALAAWLFAMSPNLLAHGALTTMELPLVATSSLVLVTFARFLAAGRRRRAWFVASAALCGLAFSCKFTVIVLVPLLGLAWWLERGRGPSGPGVETNETAAGLVRAPVRSLARGAMRRAVVVGLGMMVFLLVMAVTNVVVTGGATIRISQRVGAPHPAIEARFGPRLAEVARRVVETPIPQDWAAFVRQMEHQRTGGPSYLLGETRMRGWWYYYFVAMAVKVPLTFWLLLLARGALRRTTTVGDRLIAVVVLGSLAIVAMGSTRNYGFRYLLYLAPPAIVWASAVVEAGRIGRWLGVAGLVGQVVAVAAIHPHELSYFNVVAGGPEGGKYVLADSNLDWGQGLRELSRLQETRPELQDITLYYFGDLDPSLYGVVGTSHVFTALGPRDGIEPPRPEESGRPYIAIARSLQFGPWAPRGFFDALDGMSPALVSDDHTFAIYALSAYGPD